MGFALVAFALLSTIAAVQGDTDAWRPRLFPRKVLAQRQDSGKYVVAHHMVGNTYPYTIDTWRNDINMALANGIDGFALNVGSDSWQAARVADAYTAALGTNFKLFLSLDMTSLPCASSNDAVPLRQYVTNYANHPNQLIYRSRVLLTTFSGSACTFGQSSVSDGWVSQLISQLTGANQIWFVPSFFDEPSTFSSFKSFMDGELNWNSAWPVGITAGNIDSLRSATSTLQTTLSGDEVDNSIISALSSTLGSSQKIYIPTISPWFFAHYGPSTYNKNWIYYSDRHMYNTRWEDLVAKRAKFDIVQLLTWNDYGESSYVGPIEGAQPNSQAWVNGFDHTAWLSMTKYYARAFKTGSYPKIKRDQVYLICRPHAREAQASNDPVGPPTNYMMVEDKVWAVVFATQPAQFTLSTSATNTMRASIPAGVSRFSISISPGDYIRGQLTRSTWTIVDHRPSFIFQGAPQYYNFNAFVSVSP